MCDDDSTGAATKKGPAMRLELTDTVDDTGGDSSQLPETTSDEQA